MLIYFRQILALIIISSFIQCFVIASTYASSNSWQELTQSMILFLNKGKYDQALDKAKSALDQAKVSFGEDHQNVASSHNNIAEVYKAQKDFSSAIFHYFEAMEIYEKKDKVNYPFLPLSQNNLGNAYLLSGKLTQSELFFKKALASLEKSKKAKPEEKIQIMQNLAEVYKKGGKEEEFERTLETIKYYQSSVVNKR